jgi:hypothetical protein
MSAGPIGTIGSLATGQLQQGRQADAGRANQDAGDQSRAVEGSKRAENAAGIGEMEQEGAASDRDADGHRPWEKRQRPHDPAKPSELPGEPEAPRGRDPTGEAGTQLDLTG